MAQAILRRTLFAGAKVEEKRKLRLRARLIVVLVAATVTQVLTLIASMVTGALHARTPVLPFALFACITFAFAIRWVFVDAANAFASAVANGAIQTEREPPVIVRLPRSCKRYWFVLLHVQLHPELVSSGAQW